MSNRPRLPMTEEKELTDEECASAIANDLSLSTDDLLLEIYKEAANTAQKAGPQMAKTTAKSAILSLSIIKEQALIHHQLARLTRYLTWLTVMLAILTLGLLGVTIGLLHYASQADEHLHRIRELAEESRRHEAPNFGGCGVRLCHPRSDSPNVVGWGSATHETSRRAIETSHWQNTISD